MLCTNEQQYVLITFDETLPDKKNWSEIQTMGRDHIIKRIESADDIVKHKTNYSGWMYLTVS